MSRQSSQRREAPDPYAAIGEQSHYLGVIHELALAILQEYSLDDLVWLLAKSTIAKLGFEDCVIYLLDEERQVLVQRAAFGPKSPAGEVIVNPIEIPVGTGIVGTVAQTQRPELVTDVRVDDRYIIDDAERRSELAVPIVHEGRVLGVIDSEHHEVGFYTAEHLELLTIIASMASTKIAAALTIERLNDTVAELEHARNALRRQERRYRDLYNKHPSMLFSVNEAGVILYTNDYACEQLNLDSADVEGKPLSDFVRLAGAHSWTAAISTCLEQLHQVHRWEGSTSANKGEEHWLRLTARGLFSHEDNAASVLIVAEDVTEARHLAKELEFNATHDWLTGLHNRREFEQQLEKAIAEGRSRDVNHALCFIDLDQFKIINDTCGHAAGDALLRHISRYFEEHVRKSDIVGRIGGDEFAILMRNCTLADARRSAATLIKVISDEPFRWSSNVFSVGASVGITPLNVGSGSLDDVFSAADAACLSAKERGRNRVHIYRERDSDIAKRKGETRWVSRISNALSGDSFQLYFQTIAPLNGAADAPEHAEILLRMVGDDGSLNLPETFMPAAERYGLAVRMDEWVVEHALSWLEEGGSRMSPTRIWSINLSGVTIGDSTFLDFLVARLASSRVEPAQLCFEITETAAISDLVRARQFIERLKGLGCRFSLDDFGSGLSSLAYLKTFPVDFLKIDGIFIRDINVDPVSRAMVRSINDIGHLTGKQTIAEYVHDDMVLRAVRSIGVDFAQGHAVAEPRPIRGSRGAGSGSSGSLGDR